MDVVGRHCRGRLRLQHGVVERLAVRQRADALRLLAGVGLVGFEPRDDALVGRLHLFGER